MRGHEDIKDIPKSQRFIVRLSLNIFFKKRKLKNTDIRNKKIAEAAERYGYSQKEIADYLKMHYSTISRLVKNEPISKNKPVPTL
ncbi:MAG: helix-turn-helix domain-containing protein [Nitrospirota bacterium]|nr:helix-turn-helix domain-containing protein [Nitrospirota bacterium]